MHLIQLNEWIFLKDYLSLGKGRKVIQGSWRTKVSKSNDCSEVSSIVKRKWSLTSGLQISPSHWQGHFHSNEVLVPWFIDFKNLGPLARPSRVWDNFIRRFLTDTRNSMILKLQESKWRVKALRSEIHKYSPGSRWVENWNTEYPEWWQFELSYSLMFWTSISFISPATVYAS